MTNPLAAADFFALEAGECLDRLETLVGRPDGPPAEEFLRTARVLRGSALMASPAAHRAGGGRTRRPRARVPRRPAPVGPGDPRAGGAGDRGVPAAGAPGSRMGRAGDRARGAARPEPRVAGRPRRSPAPAGEPPRRDEHGELNTGVRAFVAREGALIASALDRAARALHGVARRPRAALHRHPPHAVAPGLAELSELVPLPEILDGIELAVGDLTRLFAPPPGVDEVIAAASLALTRISRDIAEHGRPEAETEEARRFTELLLRAFAVERDVVPIESLYFADDPAPVIAAARPAAVRRPRPARAAGAGEPRRAPVPERGSHRPLPLGRRARPPPVSSARHAAVGRHARPRPGGRSAGGVRALGARGAGGGRRRSRDPGARELPARGGRAAPGGRGRGRPDAHLPAHPGRRLPARRPPPGRAGGCRLRRPTSRPASRSRATSRPPGRRATTRHRWSRSSRCSTTSRVVPIESLLLEELVVPIESLGYDEAR